MDGTWLTVWRPAGKHASVCTCIEIQLTTTDALILRALSLDHIEDA